MISPRLAVAIALAAAVAIVASGCGPSEPTTPDEVTVTNPGSYTLVLPTDGDTAHFKASAAAKCSSDASVEVMLYGLPVGHTYRFVLATTGDKPYPASTAVRSYIMDAEYHSDHNGRAVVSITCSIATTDVLYVANGDNTKWTAFLLKSIMTQPDNTPSPKKTK